MPRPIGICKLCLLDKTLANSHLLPAGIYKGSPASFSVWADGNATLVYQWYSNNIPTGDTGTNYTIGSLSAGPLTVAVVVTLVEAPSWSETVRVTV